MKPKEIEKKGKKYGTYIFNGVKDVQSVSERKLLE